MPKRTIPRKQKVASIDNLPVLNSNAAGLDIASDEIMTCVPSDRDEHNIQAFGTFTCDLHALADWLKKCRITHVAMESTGLYWIPIFELLEARGFTLLLANPLHAKQVAGRKSDVSDAQALRLAAVSLLRSDTALGAYHRRMKARIGPQQAVVATAHKLAIIVYYMLRDKMPYKARNAAAYDQQFRERQIKQLERQARRLGLSVSPKPEASPA